MPLWPSFRRYFKHPLGWFFYFYYIAKINIKQRINLFLEKPNDSFYADVVFSLTITTLEKIEVTDIVFHFPTIKSIPPQSIYTYFSPLIQITDFTCFTYSPLCHKGKVPTEPRVFQVFPRVSACFLRESTKPTPLSSPARQSFFATLSVTVVLSVITTPTILFLYNNKRTLLNMQ